VAWSAVLLLALSPFAIRYSTEARMYALVMLWVTLGYLAVARAFERPSFVRLLAVAVITGLLLSTHYWAFALLAVVAVVVAAIAWRAVELRRTALAVLAALVVGGLTFLPWLSSFRFQLAHTGTPWGAPVSPFGSWATAFKSFGGNAHLAGWILVALVLLGLFAAGSDARHVEFDLATRPGVRLEAFIAFATLGTGLVIARISGTTFEGRYASVAFPLFLVVGAFGVAVFSDVRVRVGLLSVALVLGAWGGVSNAQRNRTQAYQLAPIIRDHGAPGDVVLFCPDAIGTDVVGRLRPDVHAVGFPNFTSPARIDWVDYGPRVDHTHPLQFADRVLALAGNHTIWFVFTNNGTPADQKCGKIADVLSLHRPGRVGELEPDPYFFEHQGLYRYPAAS
jgi:mannosyltransferase